MLVCVSTCVGGSAFICPWLLELTNRLLPYLIVILLCVQLQQNRAIINNSSPCKVKTLVNVYVIILNFVEL